MFQVLLFTGYPFENGNEYFTNAVDASVLTEDGQVCHWKCIKCGVP